MDGSGERPVPGRHRQLPPLDARRLQAMAEHLHRIGRGQECQLAHVIEIEMGDGDGAQVAGATAQGPQAGKQVPFGPRPAAIEQDRPISSRAVVGTPQIGVDPQQGGKPV